MANSKEEPAIQLQSLQKLKNFRLQQQHNESLQTALSLFISQLEQGPESKNLQILNLLESLGKSAGEDLRYFKIRRDEPVDEIGITGAVVTSHNGKQQLYEYDDLFGFKEDPLPEDESIKNFKALLHECQNMDHSNLELLLEIEDRLMVSFRRYKALCSSGLGTPVPDEDEWHQHLHDLFQKTFKSIGCLVDANQKDRLYNRLMTCAWAWESAPPHSVLVSSQSALENLSLRVFGVEQVDCGASIVTVKQDDDGPSCDQKIHVQVKTCNSAGLLLELTKIFINKLQGARKNQKSVRLYRVVCEIPLSIPGSGVHYHFKCCSTPFTVRSGSTQFWAYTSSVIWHIWTQRDMRLPDSKCPKQLEMNSVLALIQARIMGAGLRLSSKALEKKLNMESCSTSWPLHRLTDGERRGWAEAVKENCGFDVTDPEMVSRKDFIKHLQDKLYIWQIVSAAVNTGIQLKKHNLDRFFHIGLSNSMCRAFPAMKLGDFILRSSLNRLDSHSGQTPLTKVVIQVKTEEEVDPVLKKVTDFDKWTLKEMMHNNKCPCTILPGGEDVRTIEECSEKKKGHKYYTDSKQEKHPPALNISSQMENLSLQSGQDNNPAVLIAHQSETHVSCPDTAHIPQDENELEPQTKRFAAQGDLQTWQALAETGLLDPIELGSLGLDSPGDPILRDHERLISQQDEDFIMKEISPSFVQDVLLSAGSSDSDVPYVKLGETFEMSPASMASDSVCSPKSVNIWE